MKFATAILSALLMAFSLLLAIDFQSWFAMAGAMFSGFVFAWSMS